MSDHEKKPLNPNMGYAILTTTEKRQFIVPTYRVGNASTPSHDFPPGFDNRGLEKINHAETEYLGPDLIKKPNQ